MHIYFPTGISCYRVLQQLYNSTIPFACNERHRLIPLCGRCQDAPSVIALSHLYPELGIQARVLGKQEKKGKTHLFFRILRHMPKGFRINLELLTFPCHSPFSPLLVVFLILQFCHCPALPKEMNADSHFLILFTKSTDNFQNQKLPSVLIHTIIAKLCFFNTL